MKSLIYWLIDWLVDWLIDWFINWFIEWLTNLLIDWLIDWLYFVVFGRSAITLSCVKTSWRPCWVSWRISRGRFARGYASCCARATSPQGPASTRPSARSWVTWPSTRMIERPYGGASLSSFRAVSIWLWNETGEPYTNRVSGILIGSLNTHRTRGVVFHSEKKRSHWIRRLQYK